MIYGIVAIVAAMVIGGGYYWLNDTFDKAGQYNQCKVDLDNTAERLTNIKLSVDKRISDTIKKCEAGQSVDKMRKGLKKFSKEIKNLKGEEKKKALKEQKKKAFDIARKHREITR